MFLRFLNFLRAVLSIPPPPPTRVHPPTPRPAIPVSVTAAGYIIWAISAGYIFFIIIWTVSAKMFCRNCGLNRLLFYFFLDFALSDNDITDEEPGSSAEENENTDDGSDSGEEENWIDVEDDYNQDEIPFTGTPGFLFMNEPHETPSELYKLFLTDEILDIIVNETNFYAANFLATHASRNKQQYKKWKEVTKEELLKVVGIIFIMGMVKKPTISDYWSTDPLISTPVFRKVMVRDRFLIILKFLHFSHDGPMTATDRLFKFRNIQNLLQERCRSVYIPDKYVAIDEEVVLWRGRLVFRQYIPGKRHKYGVKLFMLCEPNGYVFNWSVYSADAADMEGFGRSEAVVLNLMEPLLDKGYQLYVDNYYTSFPLAHELLRRNTTVCGTLRANRKHIPKEVVKEKLRRGGMKRMRKGRIVCLKWKDKRDVLALSSNHSGSMMPIRRRRRGAPGGHEVIDKPNLIIEYNKHMGGVDRTDQMLAYYNPLRKTLKWYRKLVIHMLDFCINNAHVVYKHLGGTKKQAWFRKQVIRSLISTDLRSHTPEEGAPLFRNKRLDMSRLTGRHMIDDIPPTAGKADKFKKCVVCTHRGKRKETKYCCMDCESQPPLCPTPCYRLWHTVEKLPKV